MGETQHPRYSRSGRVDGRVTSHTDTLQRGSSDQRPFPSKDGQLYGEHGHDRSDDAWQVDVNILTVRLGDRDLPLEVSSLKDDGQEGTGNVERPEISDVSDPEDDRGKGHDLRG